MKGRGREDLNFSVLALKQLVLSVHCQPTHFPHVHVCICSFVYLFSWCFTQCDTFQFN